MATNFPTSQDNFTNPTSSDTLDSPDHAAQHTDVNDAVEALQAKVGVDSSAVTTSHDYKIAQLEANAVTDHGALTGLSDDDHTQYLLADGTRTATALTVSGDVTVDTDTLHVDSTNDRVGIGTNSPNYLLHVNGGDAFVSGDLTVDQGSPSNASLHVDATNNRVGIGDMTPSYKLDVSGDINTTGQYRIDGVQQAVWTSYTPTLYTYSGSSDTHQVSSSNGYYNFRYAVVGDIVHIQAFVRYSTGFSSSSSSSSTLRPRFSVPSGYPVASNSAQTGSSTYAQTNGWGNLGTYPTPGYNGSVLAVNDGSTHSSNGYLQFIIQRPSNTMGSSNGYFYSSGITTQDNPVAAVSYAYIHFTTWYRTT